MVTFVLAVSLLLDYRLNKLKGFLYLASAHNTHEVQEIDGINVLMLVDSSFVLLSKPLDFAGHNVH
jgi:hypothetical protein